VLDRDVWTCQGCGKGPTAVREAGLRLEIHHRLAKGRGGTDDDLTNLLVLCGFGNAGGCHKRVDEQREWSNSRGLALPTGADPARCAVIDWEDESWTLLPDGTKRRWLNSNRDIA
jgi:hypothetical protein